MNESQPPVLDEKPTVAGFTIFAANFSIFAPLIAFFVFFICVYGHIGLNVISIVGLLPLPVIFVGLIFGIVSLVTAKQCKSIFVKAIIGTLLNGFLLFAFITLPFFLPAMIGHKFPTTPQGRLDKATNELAVASTDENRFSALDGAAKESFNVGKIQDAENYANELLKMAPNFQNNWNYGNAIQDGNLVLGRIAVKNGQIEDAKKYLIEAGKSPGSPTMNSFGPNMSLAKDLLEKGERDTVLQYFDLCRKFWKMDYGKLDEWSKDVKAGQIPDFGANLVY
ncbi:MAG TPA: hypothetical protein VK840_02895 [Candidatus Dormibacteraeota bacterium]|jgi:hypothetical protein|nr:hypothetical protein [Candidatus Dormibacteraeota bacterium]